MKRPVWEMLNRYAAEDFARLHMPGHKGRGTALKWEFDVTELPCTGNLYDADGVFAESEREAARVFGAGGAAYSAGGSTLCLQAMIAYYFCGKRHILVQRACHRSVAGTLAALNLEPVWLWENDPAKIPAEMARLLPSADGVILTSPDYFGRELPAAEAVSLCKAAGLPLLVDSAHGAHFRLGGLTDLLAAGAEAVCVSLHKTLPALTGAAAVLTARAEDSVGVKREMARFGSSSPSFPILLSAESAAAYAAQAEAEWRAFTGRCRSLRKYPVLRANGDMGKLWIGTDGIPEETVGELLQKHRIVPELLRDGQLLFMLTPQNGESDWARAEAFLSEISLLARQNTVPRPPLPRPEKRMSGHEAFLAAKERVPLSGAVGKVCAEIVNVCPPCACLLGYGEKIDEECVFFLQRYGILSVDVVK